MSSSNPNIVFNVPPGHVALFGYGSLLSLASTEKTLGRKYLGQRIACDLPGWKRTWNSRQPNARFGFLDDNRRVIQPKDILYLNICRASAILNGVVFLVAEDELAAFDRREDIYNRLDVSREVTGITISTGPLWVYVGKDEYLQTFPVPKEQAAIRTTYLKMIQDGLQELGPDFARKYHLSTDPYPASNVVEDFILP